MVKRSSAKFTLCGNQLVGMLNLICSLNFDTGYIYHVHVSSFYIPLSSKSLMKAIENAAMYHSNFDDILNSLVQRRKRSLNEDSGDKDYNYR